MKYRISALLASTAAATALAGIAHADAPAAPPAPAPTWGSTVTLGGHVDVGITGNSSTPGDDINFGNPFNDRANEVMLNGVALTLQRPTDSSAKTPDIGFKLQGVYGDDSRYTQLIGEFNDQTHAREQFDIVEAHVDAHLPYLTAGGLEAHIGILPTLEGLEVMDPTGNFFYSHSYLFDFGIPLKYTGIMTETHLSPLVDLYLGLDSGVNTFVGGGGGKNDDIIHFHGGVGLNFKTVTVLATTQIGPEDTGLPGPGDIHSKYRYVNDVNAIWKINDKLTSSSDVNYVYDDGFKAAGYGVLEYVTYVINPMVTIGLRGELWRDDKNFYVAGFVGPNDFINFEGGYAPTQYGVLGGNFGQATTYGEITLGLNVKPQGLPKQVDGLTFRPEIRYDSAVQADGGFKPFIPTWAGVGTKSDQVTFAIDIVAPFTIF
jgi:hypothetical protein